MREHIIKQFTSATHNLLNSEVIPKDAASSSYGWSTRDGKVELAYGRELVGNDLGAGQTNNEGVGYRTDGTKVLYKKSGAKIQYLNSSDVWTDIITGLGVDDDYVFTNYTSLAGSFTFAMGPSGLFKMHNANPGTYMDMYDSSKNFKGKGLIDKGRMLLWAIENDPTGIRGSYIDAQLAGTNYTTVSNESIGTGDGTTKTFSFTLAFKGSNPKANCFGIQITKAGVSAAVDNYNGAIKGTGVTGSINYITGVGSVTFDTAPASGNAIRATYQWENSNIKGVTDFTSSATRLVGEGFMLRQDEGGDAIQNLILGLDGSYYSIKKYSIYRLALDTTDEKPTNEIYRKDLGIPYWQATTSTGRGILFMNTANPTKPQLTVLEKNPLGDNIIPTVLLPHFRFEDYEYDQCVIEPWETYLAIGCRTPDSPYNNKILLCDITLNTVDTYNYRAKSLKKDAGTLYAGDTLTANVYKLFSGFDDDGDIISNEYIGKSETYSEEYLKTFRRLRMKGQIQRGQAVEVLAEIDDGTFSLIGTIRGDAETIDYISTGTVGSSMIGENTIGGGYIENVKTVPVGNYFFEFKWKLGKFRSRRIKLRAVGYGYFSMNYLADHDIIAYETKIRNDSGAKTTCRLMGP